MRRKFLTFAATVSAVLCVGVCVLWVRGQWFEDSLSVGVGARTYQLTSGGDRFVAARSVPGLTRLRVDGVRWSTERPIRWEDLYGSPWLATPRPLGLAYVRTPSAGGVL